MHDKQNRFTPPGRHNWLKQILKKAKENQMTTPVDTVRTFYSAIAAGDTGKMVELMTTDIEWISVVDFNVEERVPAEVMKTVFALLMQEWESFSPAPSEFRINRVE
jgi:ketosteroid isomerase-like protein